MPPWRSSCDDNGYVSRAPALIDRLAATGRRVSHAAEWPLAAAAVLSVLAVVEVVLRPDGSGPSVSMSVLLGLASTVPVAVARSHILIATGAIAAATLLALAMDQRLTGAGLLALAAMFYQLGRHRPGRVCALMVLPFVAIAIASPLASDGPASAEDVTVLPGGERDLSRDAAGAGDWRYPVLLLALTAGAAGAGWARTERIEVAARAASQQTVADTLLEHAARGERARIVRELHDVVAHHISMIAVQAETARLTTPGLPDDGATRLLAIGDTARAALTEMRRLLGVLREDTEAETTRRPQPGLVQLNELIDDSREVAGASTRLIVHGPVGPLDPGVELTAYRIVQEALTNARRHAPGSAVDVELAYTDEALYVRVRDNGPGAGAGSTDDGDGTGHGLLGMRERAAALGGTLRAGPSPGSGFLVEATLPRAAR